MDRRLRAMDSVPDVHLVLCLDRDGDEIVVGGTDPKTDEDYALELLPWATSPASVPDAVLDTFDSEEIITHVLAEMTFYGTTEESAAGTLKEVLRPQPDANREGPGAGAQ